MWTPLFRVLQQTPGNPLLHSDFREPLGSQLTQHHFHMPSAFCIFIPTPACLLTEHILVQRCSFPSLHVTPMVAPLTTLEEPGLILLHSSLPSASSSNLKLLHFAHSLVSGLSSSSALVHICFTACHWHLTHRMGTQRMLRRWAEMRR